MVAWVMLVMTVLTDSWLRCDVSDSRDSTDSEKNAAEFVPDDDDPRGVASAVAVVVV